MSDKLEKIMALFPAPGETSIPAVPAPEPIPEPESKPRIKVTDVTVSPTTPDTIDEGGWRRQLIWKRDHRGVATALQPILANVTLILENDERWSECIALNEFSQIVEFVATPPYARSNDTIWQEMSRPVTDEDFTYIVNWISAQFNIHVTTGIVASAVKAVGKAHGFHPVRKYLHDLKWDGVERLSTWLTEYCGASAISGDMEYVKQVGRAWMISAVARIYQPGCKADHVLILEGKQGILKSTVFKTLAGEWFTDQIGDLSGKDAALQAHGVWIVELAELDAMSRQEVGRVKAFLSISFDRIRPPYGYTVMRYDRQCVFAGTVNHTDYLRDETGNRRFWPVRCASDNIDIEALTEDRDQLWAEAVAAYKAGEKWWLRDERAARIEQEDRMQIDAWEGPIAAFLVGVERHSGTLMRERAYTTLPDAMAALQIPVERQGLSETRRVVSVLKRLGWLRRKIRTGDDSFEWRYMAPEGGPNV